MATIQAIKQQCRKVVCIGRNYADHISELNSARPKQPFYFLKPPSSILLQGQGPILRPKGVSLHYEVELGLVVGSTLRDAHFSDVRAALTSISSYVLAIDMTARNVQDEAKDKGLPWSIAKGFDTFLPLAGPISKQVIPHPEDVELFLKVNGQQKQHDSTKLMLFDIPRILRDISRVMTLEKGDIVLTGTPKGVGPVQSGDKISAGILVNGREVDEARIDVGVEDQNSSYEFKQT